MKFEIVEIKRLGSKSRQRDLLTNTNYLYQILTQECGEKQGGEITKQEKRRSVSCWIHY